MVFLLRNKFKNLNQKGLSILEALISTAIVGIGFVAIFQMVNFSINSINTSGERTKANYLVGMVAEGFIGYKDAIGGLSKEDKDLIYYRDGKAYISSTGSYEDENDNECMKFSEYYLHLGSVQTICSPGRISATEAGDKKSFTHNTPTSVTSGANYDEQKISVRDCATKQVNAANYTPVHGDGAQTFEDAPRNKILKWLRLLAEDRAIGCKSKRDFRSVEIFEMCIWGTCQIDNPKIYDEAMYVGRIQININDGKKRKFLYFQSDYKIKQEGECDGDNCSPIEKESDS